MSDIVIHCPMNISRTLVQLMEDQAKAVQKKSGIEVNVLVQPHRPNEESIFHSFVDRGTLPDLTIGHVDDFAGLPEDFLRENVRAMPGKFPMHSKLEELGFTHPAGYYHTFAVIPFAMFYNTNLLQETELPKRWEELLDPQWAGKILMPDEIRIVTMLIKTFLQADYPEKADAFARNFVCTGSPFEVVTAVDEGQSSLGITNIAFARISKQKNTSIIWPEDGLFCMPQAVVFGRNAPDELLEVGASLFAPEMQDFVTMQSFIGTSPQTKMHPVIEQHNCQIQWRGWEAFFEVLRNRQKAKKNG